MTTSRRIPAPPLPERLVTYVTPQTNKRSSWTAFIVRGRWIRGSREHRCSAGPDGGRSELIQFETAPEPPFPEAFHTVNTTGGNTVVDGLRIASRLSSIPRNR